MNRNRFPFRIIVIGIVFLAAILAFEIFNFDTTRFALNHLLRDKSFGQSSGISWAAVLAIAFCGIDFAGLLHIFTGGTNRTQTPTHIWYLMGAWLLGATLNAIMTWYAVSMILIDTPIVNGVMTQEQLLKIVPVFVSSLVWLTRVLFISALAMIGSTLLPFLQHRPVHPTATPAAEPPSRRPVRDLRDRETVTSRPRRGHSPNGQP
ncbi:MAG: hypothetical protein ACPG8W_11080 [Candidatus Promineifilaceae bacterium]